MRYRRYLGSWLVMCLAAFSAYVSYPEYFICVFLSLLSIFLWWRAAFMERKAEREAQSLRNTFRPDWSYLQGTPARIGRGSAPVKTARRAGP